ncbi:MAG: Stk1 family PASTA domain-containing Ser/Thr kinase [Firmicutes bacterium]|nr:Stk1 family PASTA domain-containing Ser/Thr kinase [Bacillota bacterium]
MSALSRLAAGRYRLMDRVGEGGMAVVYRAMDELLGRVVAVKMLRDQFTADREFVERFRREAQAAARLSHPHVVQVFDVGQDQGAHYIVMEFVDGKSLKQVLRERGRLPPEAAGAVALAVAKALAHAHRHGLVHRDIKPHNILITAEGLVKVAAFGIARAASAASLTDSGTILGSVHYFSPEQARGQTIGAPSDIYSLGIVLYEMLAGQVPFSADTPVAVALRHIHDPVPPLSERVPGIPPALERAVMHAVAKAPGERPASADAFAEELRQAVPQAEEFATVTLVQGATPASGERGRGALPGEPLGQAASPAPAGVDGAVTRVVSRSRMEAAGGEGLSGHEEGVETSRGQRPARGRRGRLVRWAFVLAFLGGMLWASTRLIDLLFPQEVMVPTVVGRTEAEARAILAQQSLEYGVDQRISSDSVPMGHVILQDPEPGRRVREGRRVWVTLSLGPEVGVVPDVVGRPLREAQVAITQGGFVLGEVTTRYEARLTPNTVVLQDPAAGSRLEKGRPIHLVVSRGDEPLQTVTLPDFTGLPLEQVRAQIESLGLQLGSTWAQPDPNFPDGTVIDQNPMPGSEVEQGSPVDLIYSQATPVPGPALGLVPESGGAAGQMPGASGGTPAPQAPVQPAQPLPAAGGPGPGSGQGASSATAAPGTSGGGRWRTADVNIQVPPGGNQEVVILVIDDFGASEAYRETLPGGTYLTQRVRGRGASARFQVYIDGRMVTDEPFPAPGQG